MLLSSYKNIVETIDGEMIVGDLDGEFEEGHVLIAAAIQTNAYNRKVNTEINTIKSKKDDAESKFSCVLLENQEICFDDFMDTIDECCDDVQRAIFKKGVAIGISIMQEVIKQNEKSSDTPLRKLFENM